MKTKLYNIPSFLNDMQNLRQPIFRFFEKFVGTSY